MRLDVFQQVAMKRLNIPEVKLQPRSPKLLELSKVNNEDEQKRINDLFLQLQQEAEKIQAKGITPVEFQYFDRNPELQRYVQKQQPQSPIKNNTEVRVGSPTDFFRTRAKSSTFSTEKRVLTKLKLQQISQNEYERQKQLKQQQMEFLEQHQRKQDDAIEIQTKLALEKKQKSELARTKANQQKEQELLYKKNQVDTVIEKALLNTEKCKNEKYQKGVEMGESYKNNLSMTLQRRETIMAEERNRKVEKIELNAKRYGEAFRKTTDFQRLEQLDSKIQDAHSKAEQLYQQKKEQKLNYKTQYIKQRQTERQMRVSNDNADLQIKAHKRKEYEDKVKQRNLEIQLAYDNRKDNSQKEIQDHVERSIMFQREKEQKIKQISDQKTLNIEKTKLRKKEIIEQNEMKARETLAKICYKHQQVDEYLQLKEQHGLQNQQIQTLLEAVPDPELCKQIIEKAKNGDQIVGQSLVPVSLRQLSPGRQQQDIARKLKQDKNSFNLQQQQIFEQVRTTAGF